MDMNSCSPFYDGHAVLMVQGEDQFTYFTVITEPLPAKAGRFGVLLKQPKACTLKVILFPLLLNLSQSYQSYSSPVDLDSEYTL